MSVLAEAISIVCPVTTVEDKYPGGLAAFADLSRGTFCTDGVLARIGFMHPYDVQAVVQALEAAGFTVFKSDCFVDAAVVDQLTGPTRPCSWLKFEQCETYSHCWLSNSDSGELRAPDGWTPGHVSFNRPEDQARLKFVRRHENGVEEFFDEDKQKPVFVGRPNVDVERVADLQGRSSARIKRLLALDAEIRHSGSYEAKREVAELLEEALDEAKESIPATVYAVGVAYRVSQDWRAASTTFERFIELAPNYPDAYLELCWCLNEQGRHDEAERAARRGCELAPDSAAHLGNLAATLMNQGKLDDARATIVQALAIDPNDRTNQHLLRVIENKAKKTDSQGFIARLLSIFRRD